MAALKQKLSGKLAKLDINLDELLDVVVPNVSRVRQAIGQDIIDMIRNRTADSKDRFGAAFAKYSPEYKASVGFKSYGKSSKVNLKLTGEMLGLMDIIEEKVNGITIGWSDDGDAGKAHGHVTGGVGVQRDFLGLTPGDIKSLQAKWQPLISEEQAVDTASEDLISSVLGTQAFVAGEATTGGFQSLDSLLNKLFGNG